MRSIATRLLGADDDAVGTHEVLHRGALLEELRVGDDAEFGLRAARRQFLGNRRTHLVGRADRHGRLVHDDLVIIHVAADGAGRRDDILQVGRAVLVGRRAHRDELQQAVRDRFGHVGGEAQPAGGAVARTMSSRPGSWIGMPPALRMRIFSASRSRHSTSLPTSARQVPLTRPT
jgi:hypothetical protein